MSDFDVIVVGARCAGAPAAMLLARRGHRVLLLDRDSLPSDMPMSTHFVHARGVAHLSRWGLLDELGPAAWRPITEATIDVGPFAIAAPTPPVDGIRAGTAPRRIELDGVLFRAAEKAGVEVRDRTTVTELLFADERVVGVRTHAAGGASFTERARFVVGADGPGSLVARTVAAEEYAARPMLQGTAWTYWSGVRFGEEFRLYARDFEAAYGLPTSDGQLLVGVNWSAERYRLARQDLERSYFEALERIAPAFATEVRSGRQEDRLRTGSTRSFFRQPYGPGWVLIGDAGYKKDPCTAQGITDAFLDAEHAADRLDDVLVGRSSETDALSRFHRSRDEWAIPFYELTCEMARFAPPPAETVELYRALSERPADASQFLGLITEAVSPTEFFAPSNLARILSRGALAERAGLTSP